MIRKYLEGGSCIQYGARALNEGGYQSIPKLEIEGLGLIGCTAGFLNVPKIKGSHTAMKSGMLMAESVFESYEKEGDDCKTIRKTNYEERIKSSSIWDELYRARNIRPAFAKWGTLGGMAYSAVDSYLFRGKAPWTLKHPHMDHSATKKAVECTEINYPKPDGQISFDLLTNLSRSGTNHAEDQPAHLKLRQPEKAITVNNALYASPETRFCPAGVYEIVQQGADRTLVINAQNCLHCKTCDIKDVTQNIDYTVPEGGGGPKYTLM